MAAAPWVDHPGAWEAVPWAPQVEAWEAAPWVGQVEAWGVAPWVGQVETWEAAPWVGQVEAWGVAPWADQVETWEAVPWAHQMEVQCQDTRIITEMPGPAKTYIASTCGQPGPFNFLGRDVMADLTSSGRNSGKGGNSVDKSQRIRILGATEHGLHWRQRLSLRANSWWSRY